MNLYEGKKLKPKEHMKNWDDSFAEVVKYSKKRNQWLILIDDNFSSWYNNIEDVLLDFEEEK